MLMFRVLGPVVVEVDDQALELGPAESAKARCLLAVLLRTPGALVTTDALVERVWGERRPGAAVRYKYVGWLRSALAAQGVVLARRSDGYVLEVGAEQVDLHRFRRLVAQAQQASGAGDEAGAALLLDEGLALWRGTALAGLPGAWAEMFSGQLGREQRDARVQWARRMLATGQGAEALSRITGWETDYPLDEEVIGLRMTALLHAGQRDEALLCYERALRRLHNSLGGAPGSALRALRTRLFTGGGTEYGSPDGGPGYGAGGGARYGPGGEVGYGPDGGPELGAGGGVGYGPGGGLGRGGGTPDGAVHRAGPGDVPAEPAEPAEPAGPTPVATTPRRDEPGGPASPEAPPPRAEPARFPRAEPTPSPHARPADSPLPSGADSASRTAPSSPGRASRTAPPGASRTASAGAPVVPRQLTVSTRHFTGRRAELAALDALVAGPRPEGTPVISTIAGGAGIGKTALAVHWAQHVAASFPDGQLFVDLRGFAPGGRPMAAEDALRGFLAALDVDPRRIPADPQAQAALYRSALAGRRMLIVLDNARNSDQVRPLLPGGSGCLVLVTSRDLLTGLVATEGAHHLTLDLLTRDEARDLLTRLLGDRRAAREPAAVSELITRCARHPLALSVAAARAATRPVRPLSALVAELGDARRRLDALDGGDTATDLRAVFSWSYRTLTAPAARMFRLIGLHPGPDITAPAAASLAGTASDEAAAALEELIRANLLAEPVAGRFAGHDLLRAYAAEQARTKDGDDDSDGEGHAAVHRLLDHYLHSAYRAALHLWPPRRPLPPAPPPAREGVRPERMADRERASAWFEAEHAVLLGVIGLAATTGFDRHARQLPWLIADFLNRRGHWDGWEAAQRVALTATRRLGDDRELARAHYGLALPLIRSGQRAEAEQQLGHALDLYQRLGDRQGQAHVHSSMARVHGRSGRYDDALRHARLALRLFEGLRHRTGRAAALTAIGRFHALRGDYRSALAYGEASVAAHHALGDEAGQAEAWDGLGRTHHQLAEHDRARACYQRALTLHRASGERYAEAEVLIRLGDLELAAAAPAAARDAWHRARAVLDELHHPDAPTVHTRLNAL